MNDIPVAWCHHALLAVCQHCHCTPTLSFSQSSQPCAHRSFQSQATRSSNAALCDHQLRCLPHALFPPACSKIMRRACKPHAQQNLAETLWPTHRQHTPANSQGLTHRAVHVASLGVLSRFERLSVVATRVPCHAADGPCLGLCSSPSQHLLANLQRLELPPALRGSVSLRAAPPAVDLPTKFST